MVCSLPVDMLCGFVPICLLLAISRSLYDLHNQEVCCLLWKPGNEEKKAKECQYSGLTIQNFRSAPGSVSSVCHDIKACQEETWVEYPRKESKHVRCASPGLCDEGQRGNNCFSGVLWKVAYLIHSQTFHATFKPPTCLRVQILLNLQGLLYGKVP